MLWKPRDRSRSATSSNRRQRTKRWWVHLTVATAIFGLAVGAEYYELHEDVTQPPNAPRVTVLNGDGRVVVRWSDSTPLFASPPSSFEVTVTGPKHQVGDSITSSRTFQFSNMVNGETYRIQVTAFNQYGSATAYALARPVNLVQIACAKTLTRWVAWWYTQSASTLNISADTAALYLDTYSGAAQWVLEHGAGVRTVSASAECEILSQEGARVSRIPGPPS